LCASSSGPFLQGQTPIRAGSIQGGKVTPPVTLCRTNSTCAHSAGCGAGENEKMLSRNFLQNPCASGERPDPESFMVGRGAALSPCSVLPEVLEPIRRQCGVAHRRGNGAVAKIVLTRVCNKACRDGFTQVLPANQDPPLEASSRSFSAAVRPILISWRMARERLGRSGWRSRQYSMSHSRSSPATRLLLHCMSAERHMRAATKERVVLKRFLSL
jgi:hypothetical protein